MQGDICFDIANANQLSVQQLQDLNPGLDCNLLQLNSSLCVSAPGENRHPLAQFCTAAVKRWYSSATIATQVLALTGF